MRSAFTGISPHLYIKSLYSFVCDGCLKASNKTRKENKYAAKSKCFFLLFIFLNSECQTDSRLLPASSTGVAQGDAGQLQCLLSLWLKASVCFTEHYWTSHQTQATCTAEILRAFCKVVKLMFEQRSWRMSKIPCPFCVFILLNMQFVVK